MTIINANDSELAALSLKATLALFAEQEAQERLNQATCQRVAAQNEVFAYYNNHSKATK